MGYWTCPQFPGKKFHDIQELWDYFDDFVDDELYYYLPSWLNSEYSSYDLYRKIREDPNFLEDLEGRCTYDMIIEYSGGYPNEGEDWAFKRYRFVWNEARPAKNKRR